MVLAVLLMVVPEPTFGQAEEFPIAIPREPPRADLITFGSLNDVGEATVTGAPGSVLPGATVQLINLDTSHQAVVRHAGSDGSFTTRIFAPPGSNIMVRHGPADSALWTGVENGGGIPGLDLFPSTTIYRPRQHEPQDPSRLAFATTGAVNIVEGSQGPRVGAAWSLQGTVGPQDTLQPGGQVDVDATLRVYSNELSGTEPDQLQQVPVPEIKVLEWILMFDRAGKPVMHINQPGSTRLTPTGLPILDGRRPGVKVGAEWQTGSWRFAGPHAIETDLTGVIALPANIPEGVYRPELRVNVEKVPAHQGWVSAQVLANQGWHALVGGGFDGQLPLLEVREKADTVRRRLVWRLLADTPSLGIRGTGARQDASVFQPASFKTTQGAPYVIPPVDPYTGKPVSYRIEPQLPMISYGRGAAPIPPLIPIRLPGGEVCVTIHQPNGQARDLGCAPAAQSASGDPATRGGEQLNLGSIEVTEYYGLTTNDDRFRVTFDRPGHHIIEMHGWVEDVWGTRYDGGGTYDVWVAHPLDLDPGILPGTPLAVGDAINPALRMQPHVQADVRFTVEHYPFSDPARRQVHVREGRANPYGYFAPDARPPIRLNQPGEYRVDVTAQYTDPTTGEMWIGAATWGGIVMTPPEDATLVAHGRRGMDNADLPIDENGEPTDWFFLCDLEFNTKGSGHVFNPYWNGDVVWSRADPDLAKKEACLGDALQMGGSVTDTSADQHVEAAIEKRYARNGFEADPIGPPIEDRYRAGELPLFTSTTSGDAPTLRPEQVDQVAYTYLSSQRPGVRVREAVGEDVEGSGYWRFDEMYDGQPGVGLDGDLPDDFKFQYVGTVYRDLQTGTTEYAGQGTGWVHTDPADIADLPPEELLMMRSRVMPPFAGPGNGGWRDCGGPLLTQQGRDVYQFVLPTAVRPGAVLEVGDRYNFAGHVMPTLDSRIEVVVTGPSGQTHVVSGRANSIGWFYDPDDAFPVGEPGRWTAHVRVWHDGAIGNGQLVDCDPEDPFDPARPCASGSILGPDGRYEFYVVPPLSEPLIVTTPAPGPLTFPVGVQPIEVSGPVPAGVSDVSVEFTTTMPGLVLEQGSGAVADGRWSFVFDPAALHQEFPNVDITGRHTRGEPGLSDTFTFGVHLTGQKDGETVHYATTLTIQGDLVQPMGEPVSPGRRGG